MRGRSERIQIASLQSRIPTEFRTRILRNNENKGRLFELILSKIYQRTKRRMFESVTKWHNCIFNMFLVDICRNFKHNELEMSHEEVDTKIILRAMHLRQTHNVNVTIFSPSGDTYIIVLLVAFLQDHKDHILITF